MSLSQDVRGVQVKQMISGSFCMFSMNVEMLSLCKFDIREVSSIPELETADIFKF